MFRGKVVLKRSHILPRTVTKIDHRYYGNIPNGRGYGRSIIREKAMTGTESTHLTTYPCRLGKPR
jgi:hypothetical protein